MNFGRAYAAPGLLVLILAACTGDAVMPRSAAAPNPSVVSGASGYGIIDLGTLGGTWGEALAISDAGQIVGRAFLAGDNGFHAFLWRHGTMTDLGTLSGAWSGALGVNNAGEAVGEASTEPSATRHANWYQDAHDAVLWQKGVVTVLGGLGGAQTSALAINNNGQIVGYAWAANGEHAVSWHNGTITDLGTGNQWLEAWGINQAGQIVAVGQAPGYVGYTPHAFLWQPGGMIDLGTLGGSYAWARSINNAGQLAGYSACAGDTVEHAFLWQSGRMRDLGTLGGRSSEAWGMNDAGEVVGQASTADGATHAFLWKRGSMTDLGTLPGGAASGAAAINNGGQIVGSAVTATGETHVVMWTRADVAGRQSTSQSMDVAVAGGDSPRCNSRR